MRDLDAKVPPLYSGTVVIVEDADAAVTEDETDEDKPDA